MKKFIEFKVLNSEEEKEYRQWARENYDFEEIKEVWHPIIREECMKMNEEVESIESRVFLVNNYLEKIKKNYNGFDNLNFIERMNMIKDILL